MSHIESWHAPETHSTVAFANPGHGVSHPLQWSTSERTSKHVVPQQVSPPAQGCVGEQPATHSPVAEQTEPAPHCASSRHVTH
jgi:hypothetical protein